MANYRRNLLAGGSYFFTLNLAERRSWLLTETVVRLRAAFRYTRACHPITLTVDAIRILPDHLHAILSLAQGDADYPLRLQLIKAHFSRNLPAGERRSVSRLAKAERGGWQRRYWEHTLREGNDYANHVDYIHFNPVKHSHVDRVRDWPHSSFHRFVRLGYYPANWSEGPGKPGDAFGES